MIVFLEKERYNSAMPDDRKNLEKPDDATPKATGIGGVFFFSDDPQATKAWYAKNLGIEMNDWGAASFGDLQWKPFKKGDDYFAPSKKDFMINYQVRDLEGLVKRFKENGVTILDEIAAYDFGKFLHIMDAEGNKIELWEPKG
jgi:predicted enzyme related to lactoylglutathione lyase